MQRTAIGLGILLVAVAAATMIWASRPVPLEFDPTAASTEQPKETNMVQVYVFDQQGELVGPVDSSRVELTDAEWQERLTPEQFRVLRAKGTERPFCGTLLDNKQQGVYACLGCKLPLFSSDSKFHSGTGWPSFFQPIAKTNVAEVIDRSHGMVRNEILCARCDGHLGHVFDDGPPPTGMRFCLNSESLVFTPSDQLASLADPVAEQSKAQGSAQPAESIVIGGGCFWCTEAVFLQLEGVLDVMSGYAGGAANTANYKDVCTGTTGHAEVIRIAYDPAKISLDRLLDVFFDAHDPTQLNRQGNDVGTQYRSAIFFADDKQRATAEAKIRLLTEIGAFSKPIVTTLEPLAEFFPAEQYHQNYAANNPLQPYIQFQAIPKVCKVRDKHPDLVKPEE